MPWGLEEDPSTAIRLAVLRFSVSESVWGQGIQRGPQEAKSLALESC